MDTSKNKTKKRRGYGEGSYTNKNGRWILTVSLGRDKKGNRIRMSASGKNKGEAKEKLQKKLEETDFEKLSQEKYTVKEWAEKWLELYKKDKINSTSYITYEHQIRNHFIKPLTWKYIAH
ncbi:hypothetical protein [Anaerosphaera multitolerans]|uniref:Integrase SAM-like N-terminal domain-containing protein n=1 Tax=Anaerosphaera multitolerans TaxID=2487351 RepID=A0A437S798_9FIRM|nr:hypothetical protein [Anaerosphaera multitolerans]RVU54872.1 hypothetical protein EF514_04610 [Anaerosphaera multitolerans]